MLTLRGFGLKVPLHGQNHFSYPPTIVLQQHNPEEAIDASSLSFSDQRLCHDNLSSTAQKETMIGRSFFNECQTTHICKVFPNFSANNAGFRLKAYRYNNAGNLKRSFLFGAESLIMLITLNMILMVNN